MVMGCAKDIVEYCGVPRFLFSDFPLGNAAGRPNDPQSQAFTLELALRILEAAPAPRTTVQSPLLWSEDSTWKLDYSNIERLSAAEIEYRRQEFDRQKEIARTSARNPPPRAEPTKTMLPAASRHRQFCHSYHQANRRTLNIRQHRFSSQQAIFLQRTRRREPSGDRVTAPQSWRHIARTATVTIFFLNQSAEIAIFNRAGRFFAGMAVIWAGEKP